MQNIVKRENLELTMYLFAVVIAFVLVFKFMPRKGDVIVINCSISEISPDFTTEMREACRQAMAKEFQKSLQKPK